MVTTEVGNFGFLNFLCFLFSPILVYVTLWNWEKLKKSGKCVWQKYENFNCFVSFDCKVIVCVFATHVPLSLKQHAKLFLMWALLEKSQALCSGFSNWQGEELTRIPLVKKFSSKLVSNLMPALLNHYDENFVFSFLPNNAPFDDPLSFCISVLKFLLHVRIFCSVARMSNSFF